MTIVRSSVLELDEEGTKAAAVTALRKARKRKLPKKDEPFEMKVDRPFLFFIIEKKYGNILFLGK